MNFSTRLAGAWALLTGRGGNGVVCSFCGSGQEAVEHLIAGPGIAICNRCVFTCNGVLLGVARSDRYVHHSDGVLHPTTLTLTLSHDKELLAPVERAALGELLAEVVAALPGCELVGWQYSHSRDRFDLLTMDIAAPPEADAAQLSGRANTRWRQLRDALAAPSALSQSVTDATRAYADGVAMASDTDG